MGVARTVGRGAAGPCAHPVAEHLGQRARRQTMPLAKNRQPPRALLRGRRPRRPRLGGVGGVGARARGRPSCCSSKKVRTRCSRDAFDTLRWPAEQHQSSQATGGARVRGRGAARGPVAWHGAAAHVLPTRPSWAGAQERCQQPKNVVFSRDFVNVRMHVIECHNGASNFATVRRTPCSARATPRARWGVACS